MACIFGHKWNGCTCSKCGKRRDSDHRWQTVAGRCAEKCEICGEERPTPHQFAPVEGRCAERCAVCGEEHPILHDFQGGRCARCGVERASLGSPEYVEASEQFPASDGAALAGWLDDAVSRFAGQGSWELLEPACRAYAQSFAALVKEFEIGDCFDRNGDRLTIEECWGTRVGDVCLRKYLSGRFPEGEFDVSTSEGRYNAMAAQARPGMLHPGVLRHSLDCTLDKALQEEAPKNPLRLLEGMRDKDSCDRLVGCALRLYPREAVEHLTSFAYDMAAAAVRKGMGE